MTETQNNTQNNVRFYLDGTSWMAYHKDEPFLYSDATKEIPEYEKTTTNSIHFYLDNGFKAKEAFQELYETGFTRKFATDWIPADFIMHRPKGKLADECVVEIRLRIKDSLSLSHYITTNDRFNRYSYWGYLASNALPEIKNQVMFKGTYDEQEEQFTFEESYEAYLKRTENQELDA